MKCKKCKYFGNAGDGYTTYSENYGKCNSDKFQYQDACKNETDNLIYADYDGYEAGVDVGIDFGCIHFKPLEKN